MRATPTLLLALACAPSPATLNGDAADATARFETPSFELAIAHSYETPVGFIESVNGDEHADLVVGNWAGLSIHLNDGAGGFSEAPDVVLNNCHVGFRVLGDLNGDGFNDVSCGDWDSGSVHYGTPSGPEEVASHEFGGTNNFWGAGGDFNNDGYADFVLSGTYNLVLYYGGPAGIDPDAGESWTPAGRGGELGAGDFNGDGFQDLILNHNYIWYTYYGSEAGLDVGAPVVAEPDALIREGIDTVADFNGDGFDDVSAHWNVTAKVAYGGPDGLDTSAKQTLSGPSGHFGAFQAAGDYNGDGFADLALSEPYSSCGVGWCTSIMLGTLDGLPDVPDYTIDAVMSGFSLVRFAEDYNGDGADDLVVGYGSAVAVFDGTPSTPPDDDGDGVPNDLDLCADFDDAIDADGDTIPDGCDICLGDDLTSDLDGDGLCGAWEPDLADEIVFVPDSVNELVVGGPPDTMLYLMVGDAVGDGDCPAWMAPTCFDITRRRLYQKGLTDAEGTATFLVDTDRWPEGMTMAMQVGLRASDGLVYLGSPSTAQASAE
jgi:hypothetical protein